jgi:hypothetical protein
MLDATEHRGNIAPWWGLLSAIGAVGCNVAFFVGSPAPGMFAWLSLLLAMLALIFLAVGLKRAFGQAQVYRGKTLTVVLSAIALLPAALSGFAFVAARKLPSATAAPQVGQQVPDFALSDTSGRIVSLDQLLAGSVGSSAASSSRPAAPKAVLLIFYRGYW